MKTDRYKLIFLFALSLFWLSACSLNVDVSEDDEPIFGSSVYELFVIQQDMDEAFNILFVPDASYGDLSILANRQLFVDDITNAIENGYWQNQGYYRNLARFNYYYSIDAGSVVANSPVNGVFQCPTVTWPNSVNTDGTFADATLLIHSNELRDCANPSSGRATAEPTSYRTIVHETSHALFGLPDEYCCDSNYSTNVPVLYATEAACEGDATNASWRNCVSFIAARDGNDWWRSEGNITTDAIMLSGGDTVWEFGPADWVIMEAAYLSLPGATSAVTPLIFAPSNWDRPE
ncbi:hypothetical protein [Paraglaciecola sp. 20A4]|uniref:hypothetical protein n=1 Tax=Paraglaciecola sp. 20A4 TaxID=2687288 RepID=UPI00140968A8|nr:hypothetical protein [Paraglaciecola sp. 20A4]